MSLERPTPDSFVVVDLDGAQRADGIVRWAKKILVDGARNLARSRTYGWASLEERISGASAGISAVPEGRDDAVAAFVVAAAADAGRVALDPGKGLTAEDLRPLAEADWRGPLSSDAEAESSRLALTVAGVVAGARAAVGDLDGCPVSLEGPPPVATALRTALEAAGASVVNTDDTSLSAAVSSPTRILCCGSAVGLVDHSAIAEVAADWIVPWGPMPVTTRALAVGRRTGTDVLPDFVTTLGPLLAAVATSDDSVESVAERTAATVEGVLGEVLDHEQGPLVGACLRAEAFLSTWQDSLPFGRPIA